MLAGPHQPGLFEVAAPDADRPSALAHRLAGIKRHDLGRGAWVDHLPSWITGHAGLFTALVEGTRWHGGQRQMYDRVVAVPRLMARLPVDGRGHPLVPVLQRLLEERYQRRLPGVSLALYRDGHDSVAWHGDVVGRQLAQTLVATVSLGAPRPFLLRPVGGGPSLRFCLGWGDVVVMGGSCQRTWQHCVPKVPRADPRVVLMYRPPDDELALPE